MDLKFDKMPVDTSLAQEYLQKYTESTNSGKEGSHGDKPYKEIPLETLRSNLKKFAAKLIENKNLIAQLEYSLCSIPIADTITQLDLIIQEINYVSNHGIRYQSVSPNTIVMNKDSPLLPLGYIAKAVLRTHQGNPSVWLEYVERTKAICHLFTELCYETNLPVYSRDKQTKTPSSICQSPSGAIGVISEFSDIDSAVDTFLTSSQHVPWQLLKIFVQESVYQQFKNILSWKCKLNMRGEGESTDSPSEIMQYNGRIFLMDAATPGQESRAVAVEAYRTRKELKLLLDQIHPYYLSLWANDIAEINEIVHNISSPIIWVNNFGDFRGPQKVSEALFYNETAPANYHIHGLSELKDAWLKLNLETRRDILCKALDNCAAIANPETKELYIEINECLRKLEINETGAFINVGKDYVCLGIRAPSSKLFVRGKDFVSVAFFKSVLHGSAFALTEVMVDDANLVEEFRKFNIPVKHHRSGDGKPTNSCVFYNCDYEDDDLFDATQTTKVIWTNSGTIFAN